MSDVFSKRKRSEVMAKIRGSGNASTELLLISIFRKNRISGWRRSYPIFGKPDFVFPKFKLAIFVDGCFWHGCPLPRHAPIPKNKRSWWILKLERTKSRDAEVTKELKKQGWKVLRLWEHSLMDEATIARRVIKRIT